VSVIKGFIEVVCDGPDENTECPENAAWMDAGPAPELRKRMRVEGGWAVALPGGIDRCSKCREQAAIG
jgi:hypothetical protein